jgi:hypothetical protein
MAQRQIELGLKYLKNIRKRKIEDDKKESVKKQLFCDEQPVSPRNIQRTNTPLSYDCVGDGSQTIFFIGYKFPADVHYKCEECFVRHIGFAHEVELDIYLHSNCTYGESNLREYIARGNKEEDETNFCIKCKKPLYIIRPYHSSHLDFA